MEEEKKKKRFKFKFWERQRDLKKIKFIGVLMVIIASFIIIKDEINWQLSLYDYDDDYYQNGGDYSDEGVCNVFGIELHGDILTYALEEADMTASENIVYAIEQEQRSSATKAIILEVDSYGGYPVASEEITLALKRFTKPTVALIREGGTSGAYMAATGADVIFASKYSDVGGIGITMSYLDNVQKNQREGLTYMNLSAGKFKDTGDPNKPLSAEERNLLMRDLNIMHQNFIKQVAENRNLDIKQVEKLADGSSMLGEMALQNGLIDYIGGMHEVKEYLKEKLGEEIDVCW